jgi:peptide chain release factor 1
MFDKLDQIEARYEDLGRQLGDPTLLADQKKFQTIAKQHRDLEPTVDKFREYRKLRDSIAEARTMAGDTDPDVRAMAEEELAELEPKLPVVEEELKVLLLPQDPNDDKNIIIEVRAGTGGDEASLFAAEVFRMYLRFAELHKWRVEILSESHSDVGGLKDVTAIFEGDKVYSQMKYESGVHRVQRVPATET